MRLVQEPQQPHRQDEHRPHVSQAEEEEDAAQDEVVARGLDHAAHIRIASALGVLLSDPHHVERLRVEGLTFMGLSGRGTIAFLESEFLRNAKLIATLTEEGQRK